MVPQTQRGSGSGRLASRFRVAGPLIFVATVIAAGVATPGYSHLSQQISELAAFGQPYPGILIAGFVVFGLSMLMVASGLHRRLASRRSATVGVVLVALAGVGMVATGFFRADPMGQDLPSLSGVVHIVAAMVLFVALCTAFIVLSRAMKKDSRWRDLATFSLAAGIVGFVFLVGFSVSTEMQTDLVGLWQRFLAATFVIWFVVVSGRLAVLSTG